MSTRVVPTGAAKVGPSWIARRGDRTRGYRTATASGVLDDPGLTPGPATAGPGSSPPCGSRSLGRRQLVKVTEVLVVVSRRPEPAPGLAWVIATSLAKWRKTTLPTPPTLLLRVGSWLGGPGTAVAGRHRPGLRLARLDGVTQARAGIGAAAGHPGHHELHIGVVGQLEGRVGGRRDRRHGRNGGGGGRGRGGGDTGPEDGDGGGGGGGGEHGGDGAAEVRDGWSFTAGGDSVEVNAVLRISAGQERPCCRSTLPDIHRPVDRGDEPGGPLIGRPLPSDEEVDRTHRRCPIRWCR